MCIHVFRARSLFYFLLTLLTHEITIIVVLTNCEKWRKLVEQLLIDVINASVMKLRRTMSVVLT